MILRRNLLLLTIWGVTSCTSGNDAGSAAATDNAPLKSTMSNEEILSAVYDPAYSVPLGFFVDERAQTTESYALYHVKDPSNSFELCTDNYAEAADWEEQDNESRAVNGTYVNSYDNNRYFEFIRDLSYPDDVGNVPGTTSPGFARVFKCEYANRDGVDRNLHTGFGGRLNERPLGPDAIRTLTQYLWQFEFFPNGRPKILQTISTETAATFEHTLLLAFRINQGFGQCDLIEVVDWNYSANRESGEVSRDFRISTAIEARQVNGVAEECQ